MSLASPNAACCFAATACLPAASCRPLVPTRRRPPPCALPPPQVQIRTAKMHFFAEYGAEAAHWQYKERGYGGAGSAPAAAPAPLGAAAAAAATSSLDDDQPSAAGCSRGGAAREANWAKWQLSQQVLDQKFRPSGSPSQDQSLAALVGAAAPAGGAAAAPGGAPSGGESPAGSPPRDERFTAYLERSGQMLEPPPAGQQEIAPPLHFQDVFSAAQSLPARRVCQPRSVLAACSPAPPAPPPCRARGGCCRVQRGFDD